MRIGSLFTGYGGLDMAVQHVLGGEIAWHCDNDPAATKLLAHHHPGVPNLGDITAVDWAATEPVDVLTGGFPCQSVSVAGRRAGITPTSQSGLWAHMRRAIAVLNPRMVVIENVGGLCQSTADRDVEPEETLLGDDGPEPVLRAAGAVLGDLASLGFDAEWATVRAADVGAPHNRARIFILARRTTADTEGDGRHQRRAEPSGQQRGHDAALSGAAPAADADSERREGRQERDREPLDHGSSLGHNADRRVLDWADYAPAIHRWERVLGRAAPEPTEPGRRGNRVLSPAFVEWMQGLPAGWVTGIPGLTSRNDMLRLLGNGVVPQQAAVALKYIRPGRINQCPSPTPQRSRSRRTSPSSRPSVVPS